MTEALQLEIRTLRALLDSERDPGGRAFAPLADAYRRAGKIPDALKVLRDGIAKHPDFATGHVVAAQLYVEQGLSHEGALAARRALELDAENVVALKSLLRALDETGQAQEAQEVRSVLTSLEPDFKSDWTVAPPRPGDVAPPKAPTARLRPTEPAPPAVPLAVEPEPDAIPMIEVTGMIDLTSIGPIPSADLPRSALSPEAEPPVVTSKGVGLASGEMIDLDLMDFTSGGDEPPADLPTLAPAVEEPVLDLPLIAPEPAAGEPVMDLPLLAPEATDAEPVLDLPLLDADTTVEEPVMELAALAPSAELNADETVLDVGSLAPEAVEEPVMELADLAPEPVDEIAMDVALLAPDPGDEPVMDVAALAPDTDESILDVGSLAPEVVDEPVMELADLAPEPADETVMDMALLAPDADDEPVMDVATLAPSEERNAEADETVVDLALLAPDAGDDEPVMDVAAFAPDAGDDEPVMDIAAFAPDAGDEPVMDVAALAPDAGDEPVMELPTLAPDPDETVVDLASLAPEREIEEPIYDLAMLEPSSLPIDEPVAAAAPPPDRLIPDDEPVFDLDALAPAREPSEPGAATGAGNGRMTAEEAVEIGFLSPDEPDAVVIDLDELRPDSATTTTASSAPSPLTVSVAPAETGDALPVAQPSSSAEPPESAESAEGSEESAEDHGEPIFTRTLAELYAAQGASKQALRVLRRLLNENPQDADLSRRIAEVEAGAPRQPAVEEPEEEVDTLARDLAESGRGAPEVDSPFNWSVPDAEGPPSTGGPSIREYFEGLLNWDQEDDA